MRTANRILLTVGGDRRDGHPRDGGRKCSLLQSAGGVLDPLRDHLRRSVHLALPEERRLSCRLKRDGRGECEQEAWRACLVPVRASDDPAVRVVAHGLVETPATRRPGLGGLLDAAAGERRGSRRDRAEAQRWTVPASRRGGPAARAAAAGA